MLGNFGLFSVGWRENANFLGLTSFVDDEVRNTKFPKWAQLGNEPRDERGLVVVLRAQVARLPALQAVILSIDA